jgi:hypothetical protein
MHALVLPWLRVFVFVVAGRPEDPIRVLRAEFRRLRQMRM